MTLNPPPAYTPRHGSNMPRPIANIRAEQVAQFSANAGITPPLIGHRHHADAHHKLQTLTALRLRATAGGFLQEVSA